MTKLAVQVRFNGTGHSRSGGDGPYEGYTETWQNFSEIRVSAFAEGMGMLGHQTDVVETDFDAPPGTYVHVVAVEYSTGSTFGRDRGLIDIVDVFATLEEAITLRERIHEVLQEGHQYEFEHNGKSYYAGSWTGYFESLDDIYIVSEVVRV